MRVHHSFEESNKNKHRKYHVELHEALDELVTDWIFHTRSFPSESSILELAKWSHEQTIHPTKG